MDNLIRLYQEKLELKNSIFTRIDHVDAMVAIVYKIEQFDGKMFILKICKDKDYYHELYFLTYFANKLPVPKVINVIAPEENLNGAILMEYLPGNLLQVKDLTSSLAYEIGSLLAQIHFNRLNGYGELLDTGNLNPDPIAYFTAKFEEGFNECIGHLPKTLLDKCREYFQTHDKLLAHTDGPCAVHRDFRPGNIIVKDNRVVGIIDWSSARASFAEQDFCHFENDEWSSDLVNKRSFLAGYTSIRPLPNYKDIMPLLRLNKTIALIGFMVKRGTWQSNNKQWYKRNRKFLETFFKSQ